MPTCTPIYGLEMITGDDAPCDFDVSQCREIASLRTQISALEDIQNRTATTIPIVKIGMTIPAEAGTDSALTSTSSVTLIRPVFDTVFVDTDNMFTTDQPQQITINTPGMYGLFMSMDIASTAGSGQPGAMTGRVDISPLTLIAQDNVSFLPGGVFYLGFGGSYPITAAGTVLLPGIQFIINGVDTVLPLNIEFGAFWLGDLA